MINFQSENRLSRNFYRRLETAPTDKIGAILQSTVMDDYLWRGFHPFNEIRSGELSQLSFWSPLKTALKSMQRRMDIFFAGKNRLERMTASGLSRWVILWDCLTRLG